MSNTSDYDFVLLMNNLSIKFIYYNNLIAFPIGFALNFLSLLVFTRKKFKNSTAGFYNQAISIINILVLLLGFLTYHAIIYNNDVYLKSDFSCVTMVYVVRITLQMSSWLNAIITFDRMFWILFQNKFLFMKTKKFMALLTFGFVGLLAVINSPNLFFRLVQVGVPTSIVNDTNNSTNLVVINYKVICSASKEFVYARDLIMLFSRNIVPYTLTILMNTYLIKRLIESKKKLFVKKQLKKEYNFAFAVVFLNVLFIVTLLPSGIVLILLNLTGYRNTVTLSVRTSAIVNFSNLLTQYFAMYYNAFAFFVNLKFNKLFKKEFFSLVKRFSRISLCKKENQVSDSSNSSRITHTHNKFNNKLSY